MDDMPQHKSQTLYPNISKIVLRNFLAVSGSVALIALMILLIHLIVGFDVFLLPLEVLGIIATPFEAVFYAVITVAVIGMLIVAGSLIAAKETRYEFFLDHLVIHRPLLLLFRQKVEIPYKNLSKISYDYDGIFNMILKSGTITLDLNGMGRKSEKIEFMDNTEEIVQQIQMILNQFMVEIEHQKEQSEKIEEIVENI